MAKRVSLVGFAALAGILMGLMLSGGIGLASSQTGKPIDNLLSHHHQEFQFSMAPNESKTLPLPVFNRPVRIEAAVTNIVSGGQPREPLAMWVVVTFDSTTGKPSMSGSSFDGTAFGVECFLGLNQDSSGTYTITTMAPRLGHPEEHLDSTFLNFFVSTWY